MADRISFPVKMSVLTLLIGLSAWWMLDRMHDRIVTGAVLGFSFVFVMLAAMRRNAVVNRHITAISRDALGLDSEELAAWGSDRLFLLDQAMRKVAAEVVQLRHDLHTQTGKLAQSEERIGSLMDNMPDGIVTLDGYGRIESFNKSMEAIFGYESEELAGMAVDSVVPEGEGGGLKTLLDNYNRQAGGGNRLYTPPPSMEMAGRRKDGSIFPLEVTLRSMAPAGPSSFTAVLRDITKRKKFEKALVQARDEFEQRVMERTEELSIANDRLSNEVAERMRMEEILRRGYHIQTVISSVLQISLEPVSLKEQLDKTLDILLSIPWLALQSKGCIFLAENDGALAMKVHRGLDQRLLGLCSSIPFGTCLCGKAAASREILFSSSLDDSHETSYEGMTPHGHYCVPILSGSTVLGVINLYVKEGHRQDQVEVEFLHAVASTIAGAIEKRKTEEKLKESRELFDRFMSNSPAGAFMKNEEGRYLYANEQYLHMSAMKDNGPVGLTDMDLWPESTAVQIRHNDLSALRLAHTVDTMETIPLPEGDRQWLVFRFPFEDPAGRRLLAGMAIDTTEHKRVEDALKKSEEKYRNIIDTTSEGFVELDGQLQIVEVNDSLCKMLGYEREELVHWSLFDFVDEQASQALAGFIDTIVSPASLGQSLAFTVTFKAKNGGDVDTRVNATTIRGRKGAVNGLFWLVTDITELIQIRDSMARYALELERSNQELQDFANVASHDMQEPLRKIISFGDRLDAKFGAQLSDEGKDYLNRMQKAAGRMKDLIEDLLQFSRVTTKAKPFKQTDLNTVARQVLVDLEERLSRSGGRVTVEDLPVIDADRTQMELLFQNLISNALKYHREEAPPEVAITVARSDGGKFCHLVFEDNGIGFDEKHVDRIFKPFQRLHGRSEFEGTGMGLAICNKIVKRHRGSITVRSTPGKGTAFTVSLPLMQDNEEGETGG